MNRKEFIRLIGSSTLAVIALNQLGCSKSDQVPMVDFTIDLTDSKYSQLELIGSYIYLNGLILFRGIDQNYYALSQYCTHQGCSVQYEVSYNDILCPCHGSHFDLNGNVTVGPAVYPLYQYATELTGSLLHIYTP